VAASTTPTAELEGQSAFMRLLGMHFDQLGGERVTGWFIETFATTGAYQAVKDRGQLAVGVTNVTDFLRPQRVGRLEVVAEPIQQGRPSSCGRS
jgi:1,4-dihydroxy-2-naphthoyl-CoA hydrolase